MEKQKEESIKVAFGLQAQGYVVVIEEVLKSWNDSYKNSFPDAIGDEMNYDRDVWCQIGVKIGWDAFTAALTYLQYKRNKDASKWVALDWNKPATWPEEMRKVWIVSDRIKFEEEFIAYRDGDFYRDNTDLRIGEEMEVGLKWCYVVKPMKP